MLTLLLATAFGEPLDECFADPPDAREPYRCAYRVARSSDDYGPVIDRIRAELLAHPDHAWAVHTLGSLLTDQSETEEGVQKFEQARALFDGSGDVLGRVYSRLNLGKEYQHAGDVDAARESYLQAAAISEKAGRTDLQYAAQLSLARGLASTATHLGEAWRLATDVHDQVFPDGEYQAQILALHVLTRIAQETNREEEAQLFLERMLALAIAEEDRYVEAGARVDVASGLIALARAGAPDADLVARVEEVLAPLDAADNPYLEAQSHCVLGLALRQVGRQAEAEAAVHRCLTVTEQLDEPEDMRRSLLEAAFVVAPSDPDAAQALWIRAEERTSDAGQRASMAVERLELLGAMGAADQLAPQIPAALDGLATLRNLQDDQVSRSGLSRTEGQFMALAASWLAGIDQDAVIDLELALEVAEVSRGGPTDVSLDLGALKSATPEGTAVVAYLLPRTDIRGWATVITAGSIRVVRIPGESPLPPPVNTFVGMASSRDPESTAVAGRVLYDRLIAPLEIGPDIEEVVFVPSGVLHHLPFDALRAPDGRAIADVWRTSIISGLAAWADRGSPPAGPVRMPLLVGDPAHPGDLPPLPHAAAELRAVQEVVGVAGIEVLSGVGATRDAVLAVDHPDWVHIAAHLLVDDRFPEETAIVLANGELLTTHDVRERDWAGAVVVLSACRSASGRSLGGEAPVGMSRAFLESGATAVVGSLWPMRDDDAARFFEHFYGHLAQGLTITQAATATKRALIAEGRPEEAWAGVVVNGDGRRALPPRGSRRPWMVGGGIVGAILLLGAGLLQLRRSRV